ncbi:MAG: hypothetical protein FWE20_03215 [Defluviitaleaceae bacterium]|nr:hypothetical protein [Defluviitaleaceae bacterium]
MWYNVERDANVTKYFGRVDTNAPCEFARRVFARQGADDAVCPKAHKEEGTQHGGNPGRKDVRGISVITP